MQFLIHSQSVVAVVVVVEIYDYLFSITKKSKWARRGFTDHGTRLNPFSYKETRELREGSD